MENGFKIWSFHGRLLYEASKDRLFQLSWRPRLPSLLPAEREAEILKNLKSYTKRWVDGGGSAASDTLTGGYLIIWWSLTRFGGQAHLRRTVFKSYA